MVDRSEYQGNQIFRYNTQKNKIFGQNLESFT